MMMKKNEKFKNVWSAINKKAQKQWNWMQLLTKKLMPMTVSQMSSMPDIQQQREKGKRFK